MQEFQAKEIKAPLVGNDATLVPWVAVLIKDREWQPAEVRGEPCAPDHVGRIEHLAVLQRRLAILGTDDPRYPLDPSLRDIRRGDANQWISAMSGAFFHAATWAGLNRDAQHRAVQQPDGIEAEEASRDRARVAAGEPSPT